MTGNHTEPAKALKDSSLADASSALRQQAEEKMERCEIHETGLSLEESQSLLHELRVHQIELEMQNEELRRTQEALEASRAKYFDLYDQAPVGYLTLSDKGLILEANLTAATLLGEPKRTLINRPLSRFIDLEDLGSYYRYLKQLLDHNERHTCELRMLQPGGTPFWVRLEAGLVENEASDAPLYRLTVSDYPEQQRVQEQLRESDERMQEALRASRSFTFIFDIAADRIHRSFSAAPLLGLDDSEATEDTGRTFYFQRVHPDDRSPLQERLRALKPGQDRYETRYRIVRPDGGVTVLEERARAIFDAQGELSRLIGVSTDVTARERAEQALREADRCKDEFLAMLAHELRNPLAPIRNAMNVLKHPNLAESQFAWCRDVIGRQVQHLNRLIDDLLDVSRISRGKIELRKEPLDLEDVIRRAVEISLPEIDARSHTLRVQLLPEPVRVEGDLVRLAQVLANLLNNAAKYTEEGGDIALIVEPPGNNNVRIRIRDNGRGMDPAALPKVFDLFYQTDRDISRAEGGLGIGLSLAKKLVEMHGGRIWAFSEGRGKGSEFVVQLRILPQQDEAPAQAADSPFAPEGHNPLATPC